MNAVLDANRSTVRTVVPARIELPDRWRLAADPEFFVDFEVMSDLDEDLLDHLGPPLIIQIGCGLLRNGRWEFEQWTVDQLDHDSERRVIDAWVAHMQRSAGERSADLSRCRIYHWSHAERTLLDSSLASARRRHPTNQWPASLPWFDVLNDLVRAAPIGVTGAFDFTLKSIGKAMHAAGWIRTTWPPGGPIDGRTALIRAVRAAREARDRPIQPALEAVARYNEADCRVMSEIVAWLRENR